MKNIWKPKLLSIPVHLPSAQRQQAFAAEIDSLKSQRRNAIRQQAGFHALFASLQQRAFRGEL